MSSIPTKSYAYDYTVEAITKSLGDEIRCSINNGEFNTRYIRHTYENLDSLGIIGYLKDNGYDVCKVPCSYSSEIHYTRIYWR